MQADLFEQAPVCEASAACAQLVLAHTREPGPMGACAWAWTLFGAPCPVAWQHKGREAPW